MTYLIVRLKPTVNVKNGTSDLWKVQYHVANVAANIISPNPVIKNIHQKNPNTFNTFKMVINELKKLFSSHSKKKVWIDINFQRTWKYVTTFGLCISLKLHLVVLHIAGESCLKLKIPRLCDSLQCWLNIAASHITPSYRKMRENPV